MPDSSSVIAARTASSGSPAARSYSSASLGPRATPVDQAPADDQRALEHRGVLARARACAPPRRRSPRGRGRAAATRGAGASAAPRASRRCAARSSSARRTSARVCASDAQPAVDGRPHAELLGAAQGEVHLLLVEQAHELVAQARRGEVADEVHGAAGARQVERVLVHAQPVAALVADRAQDARGVLDEAQVVEHDDAAGLQVVAAAEVVEEVAEGLGLERHRHGVDGEVAAREVAADAGVLDLGQGAPGTRRTRRAWRRRRRAAARRRRRRDDHGRAELLVRPHVALEARGELGGEGDAVALHGEVDVEAGLAEQQVAHGAADEVAAAHAGGHGLDVPEQVVQAELSAAARRG